MIEQKIDRAAPAKRPSARAAAPEEQAARSELTEQIFTRLNAPGLDLARIAALIQPIDTLLTELVSTEQARQDGLDGYASAIADYIAACLALTPIDVLCSLTRRTRGRILTDCKRKRAASVRSVEKLIKSLDKAHKLGIAPVQLETSKQAIERQLDGLALYLLNRLVTEEDAPPASEQEPINILIRRKAAALRQYGYVQNETGLHSIYVDKEEEEHLSLIIRANIDIEAKRHVFTVPELLTEKPKEQGVVLVTRFTAPGSRKPGRPLEIYRSDMLARQPKFFEQLMDVKPPHKKKQADLIDALEAMAMAAPVENRYNATGLVQTEDGLVFLHPSGGGITADGPNELYQVQFSYTVAGKITTLPYGWKRASTAEEARADFLTLLKLLYIAPGAPGYGAGLLGVHGFAPLSQICDTGGVWMLVHGPTGSMKSATSRLPLQGYAHDFYGRQETSTINLAEGKSTTYAIEQALYYLAGLFTHLDDGLKGNNVPQKDIEKFYKMLSEIGRHAATRQGGKRGVWGQGEGGFGMSPYPRCSGVYTVETLPDSEGYASELARYVLVSLSGVEAVDMPLLTELQSEEAAAAMNRITSGYIAWLLPRMSPLLASIQDREEDYRALGVHSRTPTSYAKLETAIDALLQYGVSIGALTEQEAAVKFTEGKAGLIEVALAQKSMMGIDDAHASANDTAHIFYELLRGAFRERKLYATDATYRDINEYAGGPTENASSSAVVSVGKRLQAPLFLVDDSQDITEDLPDVWGWRWNEQARIYEPGQQGLEAGVLKCDGVHITLHMYARDFKEIIYPVLGKLASSQDIPLPGVSEIVSKLRARGKLTTTSPTNLHGRTSRTASCYVLDMTPESEEREEKQGSPAESTEGADVMEF